MQELNLVCRASAITECLTLSECSLGLHDFIGLTSRRSRPIFPRMLHPTSRNEGMQTMPLFLFTDATDSNDFVGIDRTRVVEG